MSDEIKELKEKLFSGRKNGYDRFDSRAGGHGSLLRRLQIVFG